MELYKLDYYEFDSPDQPGSGEKYMCKDLLQRLSNIRRELDRPMRINSGYRTTEHNKKVKGSPNSSHLKGLAVDIRCPDNKYRYKLIELAIKYGINRVGVYRTFIHLDIDTDKVQNVMWYE